MLKNRRIWLGVLLLWVCFYHGTVASTVIDNLLHGRLKPYSPVSFGSRMQVIAGLTQDAYEAGVRAGDRLETADGKPFDSMRVLFEAINRRQPGDLLPAVVSSPKGTVFDVEIQIPALVAEAPTRLDWLGAIVSAVGMPLFCLTLGFGVAFKRPNDPLAWLVLGVLTSFGGLAQEFPIGQLPDHWFLLAWWGWMESSFGLWATWMMLFAIVFPVPPRFDRKAPWLKWVCLVPPIVLTTVVAVFELGRQLSFRSIASLRPAIQLVLGSRPDLLIPICGVSVFLVVIGIKSVTHETYDGRRRLRLLLLGSCLSFAAVLFESARALRMRTDLLSWAAPVEYFATLTPLLLFPVVLTYVVTIRRAMTVRSTLRHGLQYVLSERGLMVLQFIVTGAVVEGLMFGITSTATNLPIRIGFAVMGVLTIVLLRPIALRLAGSIDRLAFRKEYDNEEILRRLLLSLRTLKDERAVIETITQQVSKALQVSRAEFLANQGKELIVVCAVGQSVDSGLLLAESNGIVRHLKVVQKTAPLFFDDARNWIHSIHPIEQAPLKVAQTEVLVPFFGKDKLLGVLALGRRKAESPYTKRDLKLLDEVALQAGFALENSHLAVQLAQELSADEKLERQAAIT